MSGSRDPDAPPATTEELRAAVWDADNREDWDAVRDAEEALVDRYIEEGRL